MTVTELVQYLEQFPSDATVMIQGDGGPLIDVEEVTINSNNNIVSIS